MLILQNDYINIDVDYPMGTEQPTIEGWKRSFLFYLNVNIQINWKLKRTRVSFDVNFFEDNDIEVFNKFDMSIIHKLSHILEDFWYEVDYSTLISGIEDYVNYEMGNIRKYLTPQTN